ncbi:MAG TPA: hypothetical protein DCQ68_01865 [Chryseobacterium indologenes]|nr:hypothetical protein [Chryseobacterium indologenes]
MTVYVTKFALTKGIIESEGEIVEGNSKMLRTTIDLYQAFVFKPDWYENKNEAINRAEEMRNKKIASLENQIKKLKKIKFI